MGVPGIVDTADLDAAPVFTEGDVTGQRDAIAGPIAATVGILGDQQSPGGLAGRPSDPGRERVALPRCGACRTCVAWFRRLMYLSSRY